MKHARWNLGTVFVLLAAVGCLVGCGDDKKSTDSGSKGRDTFPLTYVKLKNTAPEGGPAATAAVTPMSASRPAPPIEVGPVPAGDEVTVPVPETQESTDTVAITLTMEGAPPMSGTGEFPGMPIKSIDIEAEGPGRATATANFHQGPSQPIPLR